MYNTFMYIRPRWPNSTLNSYNMHTDKILNTAYSFAAAIVVFGAWAKLEQKEFGSLALTIGLLTESSIFIIYGLVEWRAPAQSRDTRETETAADPLTVDQLNKTMEKTNGILRKIFRAGEL